MEEVTDVSSLCSWSACQIANPISMERSDNGQSYSTSVSVSRFDNTRDASCTDGERLSKLFT